MQAALAVVLVALAAVPWALVRPPPVVDQSGSAQRRAQRTAQVDPAVQLDLLQCALAAGASVPAALDALAAALGTAQGEPLRRVVTALRLGADWEEAWTPRAAGVPASQRPGTEQLRDCLGPAWQDGVDPEPLLRQAALTIRTGRATRAREAAARLGVRLVLPLGCCLLPAFALLGLVPVLLSTGTSLLGS
ncbi:type II secretion system F family protein [Ruania suaedae]|uniref:type II secretion system F family protein n=1 Tax=Ruania suaedae TaxID=2897774 RepID=UPI001E5BA30D|nr:type II secretion system F family protein [Ruania suaedae]UFU03403.1 type II secretion system F family protein [Ruania suaedae]